MSTAHWDPAAEIRALPTYVLLQARPAERGRYTRAGLTMMRVTADNTEPYTHPGSVVMVPPVPGLVSVWRRPWHRRVWRFITGRCS